MFWIVLGHFDFNAPRCTFFPFPGESRRRSCLHNLQWTCGQTEKNFIAFILLFLSFFLPSFLPSFCSCGFLHFLFFFSISFSFLPPCLPCLFPSLPSFSSSWLSSFLPSAPVVFILFWSSKSCFLILRKFVLDTYPHTCAIYGLSARIMEYHCAIYILYGLHLCHLLWVSAEFQLGSSAPIEQSPCHLLTGKKRHVLLEFHVVRAIYSGWPS